MEKRRNSDELGLGLGGWPELSDDTPLEHTRLVLTAALDAECLADLRGDNLEGTGPDNAAMSRFVLRQAQEGAVEEAQQHARRLLLLVRSDGAQTAVRQINAAFWGNLLQLAPFCEDASLQRDLAQKCFLHVPCAASAALLVLHPPQQQTVLESRKHIEKGTGLSARAWPLGFGALAVLGFKESAMQLLCAACRRSQTKATLFRECAEILRCLGPVALEARSSASAGGVASETSESSSSWIASILDATQNFPGCKGFLELEVDVLTAILHTGVLLEPGSMVPHLKRHVETAVHKVLTICSRKHSAEGWSEIRARFVEWLKALKQAYHTRPAVVTEDMRNVWEGVALVHAQQAWPCAAARSSQPGESTCRTLYRVRGPSLSCEWDAVVADLKSRVGRKGNIWRDVKAAGVAQ